MKKLFAILAVGTILVACNNSTEATAAAADTTKVAAPDTTKVVVADTTKADTTKAKVDTAAKK